jgi:hypothetical protein
LVLDLDLGSTDIGNTWRDGLHQWWGLDVDVIATSGANSIIDATIGALKRGAHDYLRKPYPVRCSKRWTTTPATPAYHQENRRVPAGKFRAQLPLPGGQLATSLQRWTEGRLPSSATAQQLAASAGTTWLVAH